MTSDNVRISFSLAVSEPGTISISNPQAAESLRLVATIRQDASPFPDRAVTLLTTYSIFDTGMADAFYRKLMPPPTDVTDKDVQIKMWHFRKWITLYPIRGVRDMHQRENHDFITVPPPGQGSVEVVWSLAPTRLFHFYTDGEGVDVEEQLKKMTAGQQFKIEPRTPAAFWWTWGSLQHDLRDKKFSRWSLPEDLPLVREPGQDEGDKVDSQLLDHVDRSDVSTVIRQWHLPGTPDPGDEEPPNIKEMRMDGWVFGEPRTGMKIVCDRNATFEFVE